MLLRKDKGSVEMMSENRTSLIFICIFEAFDDDILAFLIVEGIERVRRLLHGWEVGQKEKIYQFYKKTAPYDGAVNFGDDTSLTGLMLCFKGLFHRF